MKNSETSIMNLLEIIPLLRKKLIKHEDKLKKLGLTPSYFNLLHVVENSGELSITELSQITDMSKPNCSKAVDNLVKMGLLNRKVDDLDRRFSRVSINEKGLEVVDEVEKHVNLQLTEKLKKLDPEDIEKMQNASEDLLSVLTKL